MGSRYWRGLAQNFIIGTLIEYGLALCVSLYFYRENQLFYALLIMLALWALQVVLWAKNLIVSYVGYRLIGKRKWIGEIETTLRLQRFPIYEDEYRLMDGVDYLSKVIKDENSTGDQKNYASASLGQITLLQMWKPTMAFRLVSVVEAALDNYRRNPGGAWTGATA